MIIEMTLEELKSNMKWWESKRLLFNLAVGLFGVFGIYIGISQYEYTLTIIDFIGIIFWGVSANILYSTGLLLELLDWYYLNNKIRIYRFRRLFFIGGLLFSCVFTLGNCCLYFAKPFL